MLFLFAKEPHPGEVKTRLCPPLTPGQAARCQRAFLEDLLRRTAGYGARVVVCATPDHDAPYLERLAAAVGADLAWQGEGDLGARMQRTLARAAAADSAAVILGSDSPDVPLAYLDLAFEMLTWPCVVVGPSSDGGYYLVGCRGEVPPIFDLGPIWGGPDVFARTVETMDRLGVDYREVPAWEDVDDIDGLRRLAARLKDRGGCSADEMPACGRLLAALLDEGIPL